jgi:hypothetical protein
MRITAIVLGCVVSWLLFLAVQIHLAHTEIKALRTLVEDLRRSTVHRGRVSGAVDRHYEAGDEDDDEEEEDDDDEEEEEEDDDKDEEENSVCDFEESGDDDSELERVDESLQQQSAPHPTELIAHALQNAMHTSIRPEEDDVQSLTEEPPP